MQHDEGIFTSEMPDDDEDDDDSSSNDDSSGGGGSSDDDSSSDDSDDDDSSGGGGKTVTVKAGDTLSAIAQRTLGNANRYNEIFQLNRDILKSADMIHPGQVLKLP